MEQQITTKNDQFDKKPKKLGAIVKSTLSFIWYFFLSLIVCVIVSATITDGLHLIDDTNIPLQWFTRVIFLITPILIGFVFARRTYLSITETIIPLYSEDERETEDMDAILIYGDPGKYQHTVSMTKRGIEIFDNSSNLMLSMTLSNVKKDINFIDAFSDYNTVFKAGARKIKLMLSDEDIVTLKSWIARVTSTGLSDMEFDEIREHELLERAMTNDLRSWGYALGIMGIIHINFSEYLDPYWGGALIAASVLNYFVSKSYMFVFNGLIVLSAGIMNLNASLQSDLVYLIAFGFLQLLWGINEFRKFMKYRQLMSKYEKARSE